MPNPYRSLTLSRIIPHKMAQIGPNPHKYTHNLLKIQALLQKSNPKQPEQNQEEKKIC